MGEEESGLCINGKNLFRLTVIAEGGRGGDMIPGGAQIELTAFWCSRTLRESSGLHGKNPQALHRFQDFDGMNSKIRSGNGNDIIYGGSKNLNHRFVVVL